MIMLKEKQSNIKDRLSTFTFLSHKCTHTPIHTLPSWLAFTASDFKKSVKISSFLKTLYLKHGNIKEL